MSTYTEERFRAVEILIRDASKCRDFDEFKKLCKDMAQYLKNIIDDHTTHSLEFLVGDTE